MQPPQQPYNQPGSSSGQSGQQPGYQSSPVSYGAPIASPTDMGARYADGGVQRGVRTIRRINVGSAAKIGAVMSVAMVAIFGIFFLMFAGPILAALPGGRAAAGLAGGFMTYLFLIVFYGIFGGIGGAIYAAIYNLVAGMMGGLQIEIE